MIKFPLRQWIPLESTSLFQIIAQCTHGSNPLNKRPFHRLCSLMRKMGAQALWIEKVNPANNTDIDYEFTYLGKFFPSVNAMAYRLFFVREDISKRKSFDFNNLTFLSCSTIINYTAGSISDSYLLYSITATPKKHNYIRHRKGLPLMNYYFHSVKDYHFNFPAPDGEIKFTIRGAPFFQRNNKTAFCMQSALATILNHLSSSTELLLPNKINTLCGGNIGKELTLDKKNTIDLIKKMGLHAKRFVFNQEQTQQVFAKMLNLHDCPPSSLLYPWMESGFPGFIIFYPPSVKGTVDDALHVVPIIGHTLNTDSWQPEADIKYRRRVRLHFRPVSAWVDNFIIHDDNFGMYLCYPTTKLAEKKRGIGYLVDFVLFLTKMDIPYPPDKTEIELISLVRRYLKPTEDNIWINRLVEEPTPLVSRTVAATKEEFIHSLSDYDSEKNKIPRNTIGQITRHLPENFWLTEITLPDLYIANKTALISIVSTFETGNICFIRLPRLCSYINGGDVVESVDLPTNGHYKIYTKKNDNETFDW
ncbi:MAG: hypothetical protein Q8J64_09780 [Thermodesulfovibrionales bacterium]|nr:hypothetical protein [Thermodesulfovibrionales bacterium]